MTKWTKLITLSSVAVLASVSPISAFADESTVATTIEVTPPSGDTDVPSVPVEPTAPTIDVPAVTPTDDVPVVTPTEPTTPEPTTPEPTIPTTDPSTPPVTEEPVVTPTEPTSPELTVPTTDDPTEPSVTEPNTAESTEPATANPEEPSVTVPTTTGGTATVTPNVNVPTNNPNISAQTAVNAGASQVGTTSQVTGQVVSNVTPTAPVQTNTGYQIVSTVNSQVVIANSDGSTSTVAPEEVGATLNVDKTISVTTDTGELKTLPHTGEEASLLLTASGMGLLAFIGAYLYKKKTLKQN